MKRATHEFIVVGFACLIIALGIFFCHGCASKPATPEPLDPYLAGYRDGQNKARQMYVEEYGDLMQQCTSISAAESVKREASAAAEKLTHCQKQLTACENLKTGSQQAHYPLNQVLAQCRLDLQEQTRQRDTCDQTLVKETGCSSRLAATIKTCNGIIEKHNSLVPPEKWLISFEDP